MINGFSVHFSPSMDERMVSVYLPPAYGDSDQAYPVMYMFDGQNAFEEREAAYGKAWHLDEFLNVGKGNHPCRLAEQHGERSAYCGILPVSSGTESMGGLARQRARDNGLYCRCTQTDD